MVRGNILAVVIVGLWLAAGPARAESAAVVRLGGDPGIAEPTRREVLAKLSELLRARGLEIMPAAETARRAAAVRCDESECVGRLRAALGVDLLVTVGLWVGHDGRSLRSVVLGLVRDSAYYGTADLGDAGAAAALEQALETATGRQALGPGPWLRVEGEPRGALVVVDGTDWGVLPKEAAISAGEHRVAVRLDGYVTEEHSVRVPRGAAEPVVLSVRLARATPARPGVPARPSRGAPPRRPRGAVQIDRPVVGPLLLGGAGLLGVGISIGALLTADCRLEHAGSCRVGTIADGTWTLVYGAGGAVALGAAIAWHVFGGKVRPVAATVGLGPGSFYLRGEF